MTSFRADIEQTDYYTLLGVSQDADVTDVRQRYRAALLRAHPDKRSQLQAEHTSTSSNTIISQLQDAFRTLSDPGQRKEYDRLLKEGKGKVTSTKVKQRPANEVSLDEFVSEEVTGDGGEAMLKWTHPCRCGNFFIIKEQELEEGVHYIGCGGCSEMVWVGYEAVDDVLVDEDNEPGVA
ncbi:hypothetical protein BDV93DRAFT_496411 [Ceratobasidium sp. AG-I]|nr:hypothetical protein BDV93DRAFT_496411 [Ceratobasidium sp. AG-I]